MKRQMGWMLALALPLAGLFWGGCRSTAIDPYMVLQIPADQKLYTAYNIWYERDVISSVNYQVGAILPFGSEVQIVRVTEKDLVFQPVGMERQFTLRYYQKYGVEPMEAFLKKTVTTADATTQCLDIPEDTLQKMRTGIVAPGMTKAQVLKTCGYPPAHRTPSTDLDSWIYWRNRWATGRVFFKDGKVVETHY